MKSDKVLDLYGRFLWDFRNLFFIETESGNFIWSDPDYLNGTNELKSVDMDITHFCKVEGIPCCRDKGIHKLKDYCGESVKIIK